MAIEKSLSFLPVRLVEGQDVAWFNASAKEIGAEIREYGEGPENLELVLNGEGLECESYPNGKGLIFTDETTGVQVVLRWGELSAEGGESRYYLVNLH